MNDVTRDTLGSIWRLCEQMAYTAEHGYTVTLKAQFDTLRRMMAKLDTAQEYIAG